MKLLAKMSWLEMKLFMREPLTVVFAIVLPLLMLFVMGGVFGNEVDPEYYRGFGAMDYYVPAYLALVIASVGLISIPVHIASNRERGVLKRYHASSMPAWIVVGSSVITAFVIALVSSAILVIASIPAYSVGAPDSTFRLLVAFCLSALMFASIGVLLGAVLPNARGAQALGVLMWFVMLMVGGAGPPPEVLSGAMKFLGNITPLRHAIGALHDGWLSIDAGLSWAIVGLILMATTAASLRFFKWE